MERLARFPSWCITAVLAAAWLIANPPTPDLAAHEYRAGIVRRTGVGIWDLGWYGGHSLPGYSVLMPPLAALTSPQLVAAVCAVIAAWCFGRLARGHWEPAAAGVATLWFSIGVVSPLLGGQLAFAAGLAPALGALLVARRGPLWAAALLGAATTLTSPVAATFLVLATLAWWLESRDARPVWVAAGVIVPGILITLAFPGGGAQPFSRSSFLWSLAIALLLLVAAPRRERALRWGAGIYAVVLVAGMAFDTPLGGNLVRLAAVFAGPLAIGALWNRRWLALAVVAVPMLYWQWLAPVRSVVRGADDPSSRLAYHAPLIAELDRLAAVDGPFRTEIPFTATHWETRFVALTHPLARGWERQLDVQRNPLFYKGTLTGERYRRWLDQMAVRYVALPDVQPDPEGIAEAALVRGGQVPGLREIWRSAHWRLFAVQDPRPLATPPVRVTAMTLDTLTLTTPRPATTTLRLRFSPYWKIIEGAGCVSRAPGDWTRVRLNRPGSATLASRFSFTRIRATGPRCSG